MGHNCGSWSIYLATLQGGSTGFSTSSTKTLTQTREMRNYPNTVNDIICTREIF
jgi:uncharacterized membrane protein